MKWFCLILVLISVNISEAQTAKKIPPDRMKAEVAFMLEKAQLQQELMKRYHEYRTVKKNYRLQRRKNEPKK